MGNIGKEGKKRKVRITTVYLVSLIIIVIITAIVIFRIGTIMESFDTLQKNVTDYSLCQSAFSDMKDASAYLTSESRYFVATGNKEHLYSYMKEVNETKRRDKALDIISNGNYDALLQNDIEKASTTSNELMLIEIYAMKLAANSYSIDISDVPLDVYGVELSQRDLKLSPEGQQQRAVAMLFDENYADMKNTIENSVYEGVSELIGRLDSNEKESIEEVENLLNAQMLLVIILVASVFSAVFITFRLLVVPIKRGVESMHKDEKISESGVYEFAALAAAYNQMYDKKMSSMEELSYEAAHDEITGLYNRKMFEKKRAECSGSNIALVIIDVDYFKEINDTHGHSVGDDVLKHIAALFSDSFRSNDYVCRIGGDEFAVLLNNIKPEYESILLGKIESIRKKLELDSEIPKVTLSIGVAFSNDDTAEELFNKADAALYRSKEMGRNRTTVYDPSMDKTGDQE